MLSEPKQIEVSCHIDDRGFLYQIAGNYEFPEIKRVYVVGNFAKGVIRGYHEHKEEWKAYFAVSGSLKIVVVDEQGEISNYVLTSRKPSILVVPPKHLHGWISLEEDTLLVGISNKTLEESQADDYREDPFKYGKEMWDVKPR